MRVDKWIWAVRMVKTRTIANEFCDKGRVKINDEKAKPSKFLKMGDIVELREKQIIKKYQVVKLIPKRVGAPLAAECFVDLSPERDPLVKLVRPFGRRAKGEGRPSKKERRQIDEFKSEFWN